MTMSRRLRLASAAGFALAALSAAVLPGARAASAGSGLIAGVNTTDPNVSTVVKELGRTPQLINSFTGFQTASGQAIPFPSKFANQVISLRSTPMITWQPNLSSYRTQSVLTSISDGSQDAYIKSWAQSAAALHHPIYVRLMHEFNGTWYPWGAVVAGKTTLPGSSATYRYTNTPAMYVAAFQRVVDDFRSVGANNVEFVWCLSTGAANLNVAPYYPGDRYVSWPAMDGYNRSTTAPDSAQTIFGPGYAAITRMTSEHILIAEVASVEFSGLTSSPSSKAQWITDTYLKTIPTMFPQVKAVDWFDLGTSYPFDSSQSALQAMRQVVASTEYSASAQ